MNLIEKLGLEKCRAIVEGSPSNAESYQDGYYFRESPEFMFHNGFHKQWNLTDNNGEYFRKRGFNPIPIEDLRTAIAEHDNYWYGQSEADAIKEHEGYQAELIQGSAMFIGDNSAIVQAMRNITDDCSDIRNHISPLTGVIER